MLILATLIFGGVALSELSVNLLPDVDSPTLLVRTDWSGAAPREIEQRINEPMEALLSTVPGLQGIHGFARQGQSVISLRFKWGQNMDLAFLNVREKLDQLRFMLPEQSGRPQLIHNTASDEPIAVLGISSKDQAESFEVRLALKRWAEQVLSRRLEQAEGIAQVVLVGALEPEVQIRYRPEALNRYGLTLSQVESLVQQANLFTATGELRDGWYRYSLKIQSRIQSLDDVREISVAKLGAGKILKLSDVADVHLGQADPTSFALVDGNKVLNVLVKKEYGANTVVAYDTMLPLLDQLRNRNPDIDIRVLRENATFVRSTINNLLQTLLYGAILAFIVLFLFLDDLRTPFTIGIAIPVSIFLTFFVMYISGIQLNIVSLSGLTLGIGLLVDNAIIVLENINRHRPLTSSVISAAERGTKEIALAVSASTFTTISVFLPLVFLGGFEGAFFKDQAWTLSISLLASLLVALAILPVLVVQIQKKQKEGDRSAGLSTFFNRIRDWYESSLQWALRRKGRFVAVALLLLALAGWQFMSLSKSVLPETEPRQVRYQVRLPGNTALRSAGSAALELNRYLQNRVRNLQDIQILGGYTDQTNLASLSEEGLNKFTASIPVSGTSQAGRVEQAVSAFSKGRPGWQFERLQENSSPGIMPNTEQAPVIVQLVGSERDRSERAAAELGKWFSENDINISLQKQYEQEIVTYLLRFKKDRLLQLGIGEEEVVRYLESLTRGSWVTDWNRQDENVGIRLVGYNRRIYEPAEITLEIGNKNIPLDYLSEIRRTTEPEQLERINQTPVLSYITGLSFADWWWNGEQLKEALNEFSTQTGIEIQFSGSARQVISLLKDMGMLLLISVFIIYLILAIQFENLKYPVIIMLAIPFAWVGSMAILWVTGSSLNALSFMGILILTGIAVNDSILKVDFMRRYYEDTGDLDQAVQQAGLHRFRPVVMTSLTTIFGLIPMLIPFGAGYAFRQSLALALMGGMVTSTVLTLYLIPIIFQWVEGRKVSNGQ